MSCSGIFECWPAHQVGSYLRTQVNPLAETDDGKLIAADAKLGFDDNAAFRQKEIFAMRDPSQEDPRLLAR
jgi:succinyl-CoA synthetase beta subunit